ncbi:MAG: Flavobacterium phage Fpv2 [Pseudomonadota bacterium]
MAYLYRHIRLDKNEPFYIGIGSDATYKRANSHFGRNKYWHNIVAKTDYEVEILLDNITWDYALNKEIEFIELYGRRIDGGILSNLTKGGDGVLGFKNPKLAERNKTGIWKGKKHTEETKLLMSLNSKGVKKSPLAIERMIASKVGKGIGKNNPKYYAAVDLSSFISGNTFL